MIFCDRLYQGIWKCCKKRMSLIPNKKDKDKMLINQFTSFHNLYVVCKYFIDKLRL